MKYKISHTTKYKYSEPIPISHNTAHLTPRDGSNQNCTYHRLVILPTPTTMGRRVDFFGNQVTWFSIEQGHDSLQLRSVSTVEMTPREIVNPIDSIPWEAIRDSIHAQGQPQQTEISVFAFDSPMIKSAPDLAGYAAISFSPGRPILEAGLELTARIHADFEYDPKATTVHTSVAESFRMRRGVCQDFAHVEIACLRSLGLPARYVSGYLRTIPPPGKPRLVGADASHAWLSLYCGTDGWVDIDPTNNVICSTDHIKVAYGRDYSDVSPVRGVFVGGGDHTLNIAVDVMPLDTET